jgi:hypothetical protein
MTNLADKIAARQPGICLYGFAPPKQATPAGELEAIAAQQIARLAAVPLDGVIVYDIQDEAERTAEPRPFPFLPTIPAETYAHQHLAGLPLPKVVYRCVARDTAESLVHWLAGTPPAQLAVLVGAPSRQSAGPLPLAQAYPLVRQHAPHLLLGGIAIAERHARRLDEHQRMLAKTAAGCRFFVTQAVYDITATKSLLSDYALAVAAGGSPPVPVILTFSPCGGARTLAFMKWLGITFPRWLDNDLRFAPDPLATSLELCDHIFAEAWDYARSKNIPLGVNVESVSIRKSEIQASLELLRRVHRRMQP